MKNPELSVPVEADASEVREAMVGLKDNRLAVKLLQLGERIEVGDLVSYLPVAGSGCYS